jgi:hypothetical protein
MDAWTELKNWANNGAQIQGRRPIMTTSDHLSDREMRLAELGGSDEDVEALLSGGADIDELIAAGVLDTDEPPLQDGDEEDAEIEFEPSTLTEEEARAWFAQQRDWFVANGYDYQPVQVQASLTLPE